MGVATIACLVVVVVFGLGCKLGLGFKAEAISLGGVGPATPIEPNPCAP